MAELHRRNPNLTSSQIEGLLRNSTTKELESDTGPIKAQVLDLERVGGEAVVVERRGQSCQLSVTTRRGCRGRLAKLSAFTDNLQRLSDLQLPSDLQIDLTCSFYETCQSELDQREEIEGVR